MSIFNSFWEFLSISSPYLILGLFVSGLLNGLVPAKYITKALGPKSKFSFLWGALLGIPLPLCSCGVIPTAASLKKSGATNAATSSFLIATPETGPDSILMTYGLLGLPMAIIRPVTSIIAALFASLMQILFKTDKDVSQKNIHEHDHSCNASCCSHTKETKEIKTSPSIKRGMKYAFGELINDMSIWLLLGLLLGSLIDFIFPEEMFSNINPYAGRLTIILISLPLNLCTSAATLIAAGLMLKGMSPGIALLFVLVGPAINIMGLIILQKYIGKKAVILNVVSVIFIALIFSFIMDWIYSVHMPDIKIRDHHHHHSILSHITNFILLGLMIKGIYFQYIKRDRV